MSGSDYRYWMACDSCGAPAERCCRDDDDKPAPMCVGRVISKHKCCGCGMRLRPMGRAPSVRFPCCGKRECFLFAKREWTRADRAKKREVTT